MQSTTGCTIMQAPVNSIPHDNSLEGHSTWGFASITLCNARRCLSYYFRGLDPPNDLIQPHVNHHHHHKTSQTFVHMKNIEGRGLSIPVVFVMHMYLDTGAWGFGQEAHCSSCSSCSRRSSSCSSDIIWSVCRWHPKPYRQERCYVFFSAEKNQQCDAPRWILVV